VPRLKLVRDAPPVDDIEESDAALVAAVLAGDRAAASRLYARHAPRVRGLLARILGVGPELDDVLQDTFVIAFRRLPSLREPAALGAWLRAVAVGEARHHLRARARRRWLTFFAPDDMPDAPAPAAPGGEMRDAARATLDIVRGLPVDERVAFALRYLEGMKLEEAAAAARVSLATFKRRLARAEDAFARRARASPSLDAFASSIAARDPT
jgi:RNA polymerase sigma-70 factor (ECF subfamily)